MLASCWRVDRELPHRNLVLACRVPVLGRGHDGAGDRAERALPGAPRGAASLRRAFEIDVAAGPRNPRSAAPRLYQAFLFAAFSRFWTVTPLLAGSPEFGCLKRHCDCSPRAVAGAIAGRCRLRRGPGLERAATAFAILAAALAFPDHPYRTSRLPLALALMVISGVLLDFGVQGNFVLGARAIFALGPDPAAVSTGYTWRHFAEAPAALPSAAGPSRMAAGRWHHGLASRVGRSAARFRHE